MAKLHNSLGFPKASHFMVFSLCKIRETVTRLRDSNEWLCGESKIKTNSSFSPSASVLTSESEENISVKSVGVEKYAKIRNLVECRLHHWRLISMPRSSLTSIRQRGGRASPISNVSYTYQISLDFDENWKKANLLDFVTVSNLKSLLKVKSRIWKGRFVKRGTSVFFRNPGQWRTSAEVRKVGLWSALSAAPNLHSNFDFEDLPRLWFQFSIFSCKRGKWATFPISLCSFLSNILVLLPRYFIHLWHLFKARISISFLFLLQIQTLVMHKGQDRY